MKNLKILFGSVAIVLAVFFVYSCALEEFPISRLQDREYISYVYLVVLAAIKEMKKY